ncbi:MAG: chromosome segregation in meiosis- protein [Geoglossum umbratile]|nr:MAG: chromosome segregation in meiosis- protein [Geoglossum umbratile]
MATKEANPFLGSYLNGDSSPEPEARTRNAAAAQPVGDGLDDLFDYDPGIDDIFLDVDTNMDASTTAANGRGTQPTGRKGGSTATALGIDEEVQITRKKRINVKLDEKRLLSQAGIPKLRRIAKQRLHFKGKGHEYSDAARILSLYQLWLDDLFPKAKFADALTMVEKLGHSKKIQVMRKGWIEEVTTKASGDGSGEKGKLPNPERDIRSLFSENPSSETGQPDNATIANPTRESLFGEGPRPPPKTNIPDDMPDLYGSPKPRRTTASASNKPGDSLFVSDDEAPPRKDPPTGNANAHPEPDELDELLNEGAPSAGLGSTINSGGGKAPVVPGMGAGVRIEDEFADEMEAMMGLDDM